MNAYDGAWIAGASRLSMSKYIINLNYYINAKHISINGETVVLTGERELWANIDGIFPSVKKILLEISRNNYDIDSTIFPTSTDDESDRIDEGKAYIMHLAKFYNIKLNTLEPFVQYKNKDECPPNRYPNRIYANYDSNETAKLTEALMSADLIKTYLNTTSSKIYIVNAVSENGTRLDTATTARGASERLVRSIIAGEYGDKKNFTILFCSSNPYIDRKTLSLYNDRLIRCYKIII